MITISSKITGVDLWAYDFSRRPVKDLDSNGNPQRINYNKPNAENNYIVPVTKNPTEFTDKFTNAYRLLCDIHHHFNGQPVWSHGIIQTNNSAIDQANNTFNYYSSVFWSNVKFSGDDINISSQVTITDSDSKTSFTTSTPGINILNQTGIVQSSRGNAVIIFEIQQDYEIPVGNTIKITPAVSGAWGATRTGTPETYEIAYPIEPGIYEITAHNAGGSDWLKADIDFATVKVAPTPAPTPTPTPTPTTPTTIPFVQELTNATSNISGASIDRKLNAINLTANTGYIFNTSIQVLFYTGGKVVSEYTVDGNGKDSITIPLNTVANNTITTTMDDIKLTTTATLPTASTGYEHNYLITDTELSAFSRDRIWDGASDSGIELYDVSAYINNLIELPFVVKTDSSLVNIAVGKKQSNVLSHETNNRFITLDLGTIKVPAKYNNGYDYQNKTIKLFTPFVPPITINNENAIENTIHIVYKIDISTGNLTVNLYNDTVLFFTGINNVASELPFLNKTKNTIISHNVHFNDNDIRQPYIVVTREEPILNNDYYPTIERGIIKNYNGSVRVRLLNNIHIPNNELTDLARQLESGVTYVKSN